MSTQQFSEPILYQSAAWVGINECFQWFKKTKKNNQKKPKTHCYSGLLAVGAVIENILANKQRFIGTMEAGSEQRIMQWNLTGLRGATWAEELINVWGPGGIICAFVNVLNTHTKALIVLSVQQMFSAYQPVYTITVRHRSQNGGSIICFI